MQGLFTPLLPPGELFAGLLTALAICGCVCGEGRALFDDNISNVHPGIDSLSFLFAMLSKVDSYFRMIISRSVLACFLRAIICRMACNLVRGWYGSLVLHSESLLHGVFCHASDSFLESCTLLSNPSLTLDSSSSSGFVGIAFETGIVKPLILGCLV